MIKSLSECDAWCSKETVKVIESLVEQGLLDGKQGNWGNIGIFYTDLKVEYRGKQAAIREKRQAAELEKQMPVSRSRREFGWRLGCLLRRAST